jgi:hypothetical protein
MEITTICGIDFSGAAKAGRKIWIAEAAVEANHLRINRCTRACDLVGSSRDRTRCLPVLREFIGRPGRFAYGADFPFGLPAALVEQSNWQEFVLNFAEKFPSDLEFSDLLHIRANAKELKRITDIEARTPLSPYNLRIFRQTYYGIRMSLHR